MKVTLDLNRIIRRRSDENLSEKSTGMSILDPMRRMEQFGSTEKLNHETIRISVKIYSNRKDSAYSCEEKKYSWGLSCVSFGK